MSANKKTVEKYMESFNRLDHEEILSLLTDDVEWVFPGVFHRKGKEAFDKEISVADAHGIPRITVTRIVEENNVVVAEGKVAVDKKAGGVEHVAFCDVFEMEHGKIRKLTSYVLSTK